MNKRMYGMAGNIQKGYTDKQTQRMKEKADERNADKWEIRKDGRVYVSSTVKNCGYHETALKSLRQKGYDLYHNGKKVKPSGRTNNG